MVLLIIIDKVEKKKGTISCCYGYFCIVNQ